jgi:hypothetical protein
MVFLHNGIPDNHLLRLDLLSDMIIRDNYLHKYNLLLILDIITKNKYKLDRYELSYVTFRIKKQLNKSSQPIHEQGRLTDFK